MKMTGDDELDFIREAGSDVFNFQAKLYAKFLAGEVVAIAILSGLIALLSVTVATWVATILGGLALIQALGVVFLQWRARKFLKRHTSSTDALDAVTRGFFE